MEGWLSEGSAQAGAQHCPVVDVGGDDRICRGGISRFGIMSLVSAKKIYRSELTCLPATAFISYLKFHPFEKQNGLRKEC